MSKVSIVIPNWNGAKYLEECLNSLKEIAYDNYLVVVVDNGSLDNSVSVIKKKYGQVTVIENKENLGFAAAVNQGIKFSINEGCDYVLLLNNDTKVAPDFLDKMLEVFKEEKVGIVGAKIYYYDEPDKIWFAGGRFIKWRASGQHVNWMGGDKPELRGAVDSDFITGCAMLIKKEVFDDIGFFYEPYFLTVEDLDFCYQAKRNGWQIKVALDAKIWHKVSFSRQGEFSFSNGYYGTRNRLYFAFRRTKNCFGGLMLLLVVLPIRILQRSLQGNWQMVKATFLGIKDFFSNKMEER
jgi:GT2 family glycosyltransferase